MKKFRWPGLLLLNLLIILLIGFTVSCQRDLIYLDEIIYTNAPAVITNPKVETNYNLSLNTVGYLPGSRKVATIGADCTYFMVYQSNTTTLVYSNSTTQYGYNSNSLEIISLADFSAVSAPGDFALIVPEIGKTNYFTIASGVYNNAFKTAMLGMYLWRCGTAVSAVYNGETYSHQACHTNDADASLIGTNVVLDGLKGWHDAGDYNKYTVNAGVTVGLLFKAWENYQSKIETITLDVPEQGNGLPDFLNEMKWEIDWLFTMQYPDGSGRVSHKLSARNFDSFELPEAETNARFFTPYGTTATADFVAMMAMSARIFGPYDAVYSNKCINAAILSYTFLTNNLGLVVPNQTGFGTGGYDDGDDSDERLWAAAELWQTTGDPVYLNDFETRANLQTKKVESELSWANVKDLAILTYLQSPRAGKNPALVSAIQNELISTANAIASNAVIDAYGRPLGKSYYWGCNGSVAGQVALLQAANKINPDTSYIYASEDALSHLFGRNYHSRSYVTGLGVNPPQSPHDRRSGATGKPWPGYLVGGPWPGPKDWTDTQANYQQNEIAINWNAPLIYALASFIE